MIDYNSTEKKQERVLIAKDALAWIKAGALTPRKGVYVSTTNSIAMKDQGKQLRDVVLGRCRVCAKGALFLAKVVRYNNVLATQICEAGNSGNAAPLREHFSVSQLDLIESSFEGWGNTLGDLSVQFWEQYKDDKSCLIAVLKNIISNNGEFVFPTKFKVAARHKNVW